MDVSMRRSSRAGSVMCKLQQEPPQSSGLTMTPQLFAPVGRGQLGLDAAPVSGAVNLTRDTGPSATAENKNRKMCVHYRYSTVGNKGSVTICVHKLSIWFRGPVDCNTYMTFTHTVLHPSGRTQVTQSAAGCAKKCAMNIQFECFK